MGSIHVKDPSSHVQYFLKACERSGSAAEAIMFREPIDMMTMSLTRSDLTRSAKYRFFYGDEYRLHRVSETELD